MQLQIRGLVLFFQLLTAFFLCYLQSDMSVQFDDLFKRAWEEDASEYAEDGVWNRKNIIALSLSPPSLSIFAA